MRECEKVPRSKPRLRFGLGRGASGRAARVGEAGLIPDWPPGTASDDLGLMLQRVPGCYFNVGNGTDESPGEGGCPVHNAGYGFNDRILPSTASLYVRLAQRYLVEG